MLFGVGSARAHTAKPLEVTNALEHRTYDAVKGWLDWLQANGAKGYFGETSTPNNLAGPRPDVDQWLSLLDKVYGWLDEASVDATAWVGSRMSGSTHLRIYGPADPSLPLAQRAVGVAHEQARVVEAHPTAPSYQRGVNANGGELGTDSTFSNANPGVFGGNYFYPDLDDFTYLAGRGHKIVRIPFRWERVQPKLYQALSSTEILRLKACVADAGRSGMKAILDAHNFANYRTAKSQENRIGSAEVPVSAFTDLWSRLAKAFKGNSDVRGFDLMNEPMDMPSTATKPAAALWEETSQEALSAIRNAGARGKVVYVAGYHKHESTGKGGVFAFVLNHPDSWIADPAKKFAYTTHGYWGRNHYEYTYDVDNAYWSSRGY